LKHTCRKELPAAFTESISTMHINPNRKNTPKPKKVDPKETKGGPPPANPRREAEVCVLGVVDENTLANLENNGVAKVETASPGGTTKTHEGRPLVSLGDILTRLTALEERVSTLEDDKMGLTARNTTGEDENLALTEHNTEVTEHLTKRITKLEDDNKDLKKSNKDLKESNTKMGNKMAKLHAKISNLEKHSGFFTSP